MARKIKFAQGEFYHVYNRGVEKRVIFDDKYDYQRFLLLLLLGNDDSAVDIHQSIRDETIPNLIKKERKPIVRVCAFCLMPNHFHLLLKEIVDSGISKFMHKIGTGYSMYFNKHYKHTGSLFQGTYKAEHAGDDRYLKYLFEYIHLNPVRKIFEHGSNSRVLISSIKKNPYTSLSAYVGTEAGRLTDSVVDRALFNETYDSVDEHVANLFDWKYNKLLNKIE